MQIRSLCEMLKLNVEEGETHTPCMLRIRILQHLEEDDICLLEDEGISILLDAKDKIDSLRNNDKEETDSSSCAEHETSSEGQQKVALGIAPERSEKITGIESECAIIDRKMQNISVLGENVTLMHPVYKKELKIIGQIGEPGQRDKLNFTSLDRQIHRACKRGYDEGEIVEAVIQAIIPGVSLRSYLESRTDLTLPVLKQILSAHFIEKDATELYHSLTRAVQEPKETPIQFLVRTMDLRQRILSAFENVKTGLKYNRKLIQNQFLQRVLTGLHDDSIRTDLKPYLENPLVEDEVLLEKMNMSYILELERKSKFSITRHKSIKVATISEEEQIHVGQDKSVSLKKEKAPKPNNLMDKMDAWDKVICEAI